MVMEETLSFLVCMHHYCDYAGLIHTLCWKTVVLYGLQLSPDKGESGVTIEFITC